VIKDGEQADDSGLQKSASCMS